MKLYKLIAVLLMFSHITYGQSKNISIIDQKVIEKNKVYKCLEYDFQDSIGFFKTYINGLYTIFDSHGRKIEENTYSSGITNEIKVIYSYDKYGRLYMWHWYQENAIPKITRTRIEKYDTTGKNIGYCEYGPDTNELCDTYNNKTNITDTIIKELKSSRIKMILTFYDTTKKDTIYRNSYFYSKGHLDSTILVHFEKGKRLEKLSTKYYYQDGILKRTEFTRHYEGHTTETNAIHYLKCGLPDKIETINYYEPKIEKKYRKFIYTFWK